MRDPRTAGSWLGNWSSDSLTRTCARPSRRAWSAEEQELDHDVDLIVMNTCAVRENAAERMYGTIGLWAQMKRERPNLQIAVGGCMAQLDRERIAEKAPWVDAVFGTKNIEDLPALLDQARREGRAQVRAGASHSASAPSPRSRRQ